MMMMSLFVYTDKATLKSHKKAYKSAGQGPGIKIILLFYLETNESLKSGR